MIETQTTGTPVALVSTALLQKKTFLTPLPSLLLNR